SGPRGYDGERQGYRDPRVRKEESVLRHDARLLPWDTRPSCGNYVNGCRGGSDKGIVTPRDRYCYRLYTPSLPVFDVDERDTRWYRRSIDSTSRDHEPQLNSDTCILYTPLP